MCLIDSKILKIVGLVGLEGLLDLLLQLVAGLANFEEIINLIREDSNLLL